MIVNGRYVCLFEFGRVCMCTYTVRLKSLYARGRCITLWLEGQAKPGMGGQELKLKGQSVF